MSLAYCTLAFIVSVFLDNSLILAKPTNSVTNQRVERFKERLLIQLGYSEPPVIRNNISDSIQQQRIMIRKYKEHIKGRVSIEEERHPETVNVYKPKDSFEIPTAPSEQTLLLNFDVEEKHPDDPAMETIISRAHVKLPVKGIHNLTSQIRINLEASNKNGQFDMFDNEFVFSNFQTNADILYFDITDLLRLWIEGHSEQFGIRISLSANISHVLKINSKILSDDNIKLSFHEGMEPVLEVFSHRRLILGREKRQVDTTSRRDCVKGDGENRCCRFRTYISFADIGWDSWIIKPSGYEAYYCDGECPHRFKMANTFAGIKSLLHMKNPSTFSPPCCVPSKLTPFTILHRDENGQYAFMDLDDMIVEDCKCA